MTAQLRDERRQLPAMLEGTLLPSGEVDLACFDRFRRRLLWHIAVEERVLMPRLVDRLGAAPRFQKGMRKDHEGIVALCVATPNSEWVENLKELLEHHHRLEELDGGLFPLVEQHLGDDAEVRGAVEHLPALRLPAFSDERVGEQIQAVLCEVGLAAPVAPN